MPRKTAPTLSLTETQRDLLLGAAQRRDRALKRPKTMTERAFTRALSSLVKSGLAEAAQPDTPAGKKGQRQYTITSAGLAAILVETPPTAPPELGFEGFIEGQQVMTPPRAPEGPTTKRALLIAMLGRAEGATIADLMGATGWLPHTTRAALTGLRQKGFRIERARSEAGVTFYRIVGRAESAAAQAEAA